MVRRKANKSLVKRVPARSACHARGQVWVAILLAFAYPSAAAPPTRSEAIRVTLLGTGTPTPESDRAGPATVVVAGDKVLMFDAGRGTVVRLVEAGFRLSDVDALFITHLHSDHVVGLPDLLLSGRLPADYGMRRRPLTLIGPTGTARMARGLEQAFSRDVEMRSAGQQLDPEWASFAAVDFPNGGVVFDAGGVRVTAIDVEHGAEIKPNFAYRVDYEGRSVVISGDTTFDKRLIAAARGVDLLIHEVVSIPALYLEKFPGMRRVLAKHTSPEQAGHVFKEAKPRLAVYYHLALIGGTSTDDVVSETRRVYSGPLLVGQDLMTFEIGETISIHDRLGPPRD